MAKSKVRLNDIATVIAATTKRKITSIEPSPLSGEMPKYFSKKSMRYRLDAAVASFCKVFPDAGKRCI